MRVNGATSRLLLGFVVLLLAVPSTALATNGMYLAGYGAEANGRGGTNIAVADRALALQTNPAGIAQLQGNHFSVDLQVLVPEQAYRGDAFGNNLKSESAAFFMPSFSYVRGGEKWAWGIGLVSQGGMGATFENFNTPFGTTDETFSEVRFANLTPTFAYSFTENLSIGLTANLGYSDVAFRFWPRTSFFMDQQNFFFGANLKDPPVAFNYSGRLGLMWRATPKWQFGFVYQTKTEGDYKDGTLVLDMSSIGMGDVSYDAKVENFTWPEQYGIGVQFRPGQKWMVAFDVKRYLWSDAVSNIAVTGTNPSNSMAFPEVELPFAFLWEDQTVYLLGLEYRVTPDSVVRAGYNYGKSPVPDGTLNPLFPATTEKHLTLGGGWNWGKGHAFNVAIERAFENSQTNSNTNPMMDPFAGSTIDHEQWTISFGYSKAFARKK